MPRFEPGIAVSHAPSGRPLTRRYLGELVVLPDVFIGRGPFSCLSIKPGLQLPLLLRI